MFDDCCQQDRLQQLNAETANHAEFRASEASDKALGENARLNQWLSVLNHVINNWAVPKAT